MTEPEESPASPLKGWQRAELTAFVVVVGVQVWLYRVSVVVAAAWGLLVPLLALHIYLWLGPLVRRHHDDDSADGRT